MPRFTLLTAALALAFTASMGACTVHHHHQGTAEPGYQTTPAQAPAAQGAPGQVIQDPYSAYDQRDQRQDRRYEDSYEQPRPRTRSRTYVAPRAPRRAQAAPCTCDHAHDVPASVAPRTLTPRGPVTPAQIESDPADWLE